MHEILFQYIRSYSTTPLTASDLEMLRSAFVPKKVRKRQYFLEAGEVCKYTGFVVKGAMRQYSVDEKGAEHIVRLCIENWWAGDRESFTMLTPSIYNIDAWEDTDLLTITNADLNGLSSIAAMNELTKKLDLNQSFAFQKRLNSAISLPADKRYAELEKTYPEFLLRFPQHIIASYLGITKETLSRIRKQAVKK